MIYLDNAATTKIDDRVLCAMTPYLKEQYGNPGALYSLGRESKRAVDKAREQVAELINCDPEQIVFTSGGSEANNLAIKGFLEDGDGVVISRTEHDSVWNAADGFRYAFGAATPFVNGTVGIGAIDSLLNEYSQLVSVMYVNNETGAINPVKRIAERCHEHKLYFHTDCVQALGAVPVDVRDIGCDFASFSSHKIHGPKGVGALFVKNRDLLTPLVFGGKEQEFGLRGGTENVAGIVGFGEACRITRENLSSNIEYVTKLRDTFLEELTACIKQLGIPDETMHINGNIRMCSPKVLSLRFEGVDAQSLVLMMDANGVCISAGSACHSHENRPSRTLLAMMLSPDQARSSVRVSFSVDNTVDEVKDAARILANCVLTLAYNNFD